MKKFTAILLALVLMLAMSTSAFAATITAPTDSPYTYTAYKIFDVTKSTDGGYAYSIAADSEWLSAVQALTSYVTLTKSADGSAYTVSWVGGDDSKDFADALKNSISGKTAAATITKDAAKTVSEGYYLITSTAGTALVLATTNVTIEEKNGEPDLDKTVAGGNKTTTANRGDVLTFVIEVDIPSTAIGTIVVHDKMTGLEYQSMTAVDGVTAVTEDLTDGCAVHFVLSADCIAANLGKKVTITYTAKVTADTANNEAYLVNNDFSSVPNKNDVYSTNIVIDKYTATDESVKLAGAKFVLKNSEGAFYKVASNGDVSWVADQTNATVVTTDENGAATFTSLADGTYKLVEIEAPAGYNLLTSEVAVEVNALADDGTVVGSVTAKVANSTGSALPSTGGMGTTIFYVVGGLMVAMAVVILVAKKKVGAAE